MTTDGFVGEYSGFVISEFAAQNQRSDYLKDKSIGYYTMSLGENNLQQTPLYVDARDFDSPLKYVNHSCDPNCRIEIWTVEGLPRVGIFANEPISKGCFLTIEVKQRGLLMVKCASVELSNVVIFSKA